MFPISHFYLNQLLDTPSSLLAIGGIFPDIADACGIEREKAHHMGLELYQFCQIRHPEALDLARGIFMHGCDEGGADYYSDECWGEGQKGWCFQRGSFYMESVGRATGLEQKFWWWKSHNFVELALEMITDCRYPHLKLLLSQALADKQAQKKAASVLHEFAEMNEKEMLRLLNEIDSIFELKQINYLSLAMNQQRGIMHRFHQATGDVEDMAQVLKQIVEDMLKDDAYDQFMMKTLANMRKNSLF